MGSKKKTRSTHTTIAIRAPGKGRSRTPATSEGAAAICRPKTTTGEIVFDCDPTSDRNRDREWATNDLEKLKYPDVDYGFGVAPRKTLRKKNSLGGGGAIVAII